MAVLWLLLLGGLSTFFLGHFVWAVVTNFLTTEVPSSLKNPVKLRVMHCFVLFLIALRWRLSIHLDVIIFPRDSGLVEGVCLENPRIRCHQWAFFVSSHGRKTSVPMFVRRKIPAKLTPQETMPEGTTLEKLRICTMDKFVQFVGDIGAVKKDPTVLVTNMRFGSIPVRLFQPKAMSSKLRRGIIFYHGGGSFFGSMDTYHSLCSFLVRETDSVLLSVGYRKLPYFHHPVPFNDCLSATIQFLKGLETYGVDPSRVVLCGESMGAWVVATIVQVLLRSPSLPKIRAQILITPVIQAINLRLPSHQKNKNVPFLTRELMIFCICKYLAIDLSWKDAMLTGAVIPLDKWKKYRKWVSSDNIPRRFWSQDLQPEFLGCFNEAAYLETKHIFDVQISPVLADDEIIAQLPEALMVTCENDTLRDDGLLYKKRLEDQGVPVTWNHVEDGFHGCLVLFDWKFLSFPCSVTIVNTVVGYIKNI